MVRRSSLRARPTADAPFIAALVNPPVAWAGQIIEFGADQSPNVVHVIDGFAPGDSGDQLALGEFLVSYLRNWDQASNPFATGHLKLRQVGADVVLFGDIDGGANDLIYQFIRFTGVTLADFTKFNFFGYSPRGADVEAQTISGTNDADQIATGYGDDQIRGGGGDDVLSGDLGKDRIFGGDGDDRIDGGAAADRLSGDAGADQIQGGLGDDTIAGGDGDDVLTDVSGSDRLDGGDGNDRITIDRHVVREYGAYRAGEDVTILGGAGDDLVDYFSDQYLPSVYDPRYVPAELGRLSIDLGDGDDHLILRETYQVTTITLGEGRDLFDLVDTSDKITITDFAAGPGGDTLRLDDMIAKYARYWDGSNPFALGLLTLTEADGAVTLKFYPEAGNGAYATVILQHTTIAALDASNFNGFAPDGSPVVAQTLVGTSGADILTGRSAGDTISGLDGDDRLDGGVGNDRIDGGAGNDMLTGSYGDDVVDGGDGDDFITEQVLGVDTLRGGAGNDTIIVRGYNDYGGRPSLVVIEGGDGNDTVDAIVVRENLRVDLGAGDDLLILSAEDTGHLDERTITLGRGSDTIRISELMYPPGSGRIVVTDFKAGVGGDLIDLRAFADAHLNEEHIPDYNPFAAGTVRLVQVGRDVEIRVGETETSVLLVLRNVQVANLVDANFGFDLDAPPPPGETYTGTQSSDDYTGTSLGDTVTLLGGSDAAEGRRGDDAIDGGGGNDELYGNEGNDRLIGGSGNDTLDGGSGIDRIEGGDGNDTIVFSDGLDSIDGGAGFDTLSFESSAFRLIGIDLDLRTMPVDGLFKLGGNIVTSVEKIDGYGGGSGADDRILFGALWESGGPFYAYGGNDEILSGSGASQLFGGDGNDILTSLAGDDELTGEAGDDRLSAGSGNDILEGGAGNDRLDGGKGDDGLLGDEGPFGGDGDDVLTGGAGNDFLFGGGGQDSLSGGSGNDIVRSDGFDPLDRLDGGRGKDTLRLFATGDETRGLDLDLRAGRTGGTVLVDGVAGNISGFELFEVGLTRFDDRIIYDSVYKPAVTLTGDLGDDQIVSGAGADTLSGDDGNDHIEGNAGNDTITGGSGDDILDGGAGADQMSGGTGNDTYYIDNVLDYAFEATNPGDGDDDRVFASVSVILSQGIERVTLTGTANSAIVANSLDNIITGNAGDNLIDPGFGLDRIDGGDGYDTVTYANHSGAVTADLTRGTPRDDVDGLTSIEGLIGSNYDDDLRGNDAANAISGGGGGDHISGGAGNDSLLGEAGNDLIVGGEGDDLISGGDGIDYVTYYSATGGVRVDLGAAAPQATGQGIDSLNSIEGVTGSRFDDELIGDGNANVLLGLAGNDQLTGGLGDDTLLGGDGVDTVRYDGAGSAVVIDLSVTVAQDTLGAGLDIIGTVENVVGSAFADVLGGTGGANRLDGGAGDDILLGQGGTDMVIGGDGYDLAAYFDAIGAVTVDLSNSGAQNTGGDGTDTLVSIEGLLGSTHDDRLVGGAGDDLLMGYFGNDTLTGGAGADRFWFVTAPDVDTITDFVHGTDRILIDTYLFNVAGGTLAAGAFVLGTEAKDTDDRILYDQAAGALYFDWDGAGGETAVKFAMVTAGMQLAADDFFGL